MGTLRDDVDDLKIKIEAVKLELASLRQLAMEARVAAEIAKERGSFQYHLGQAPMTPQYDPLAGMVPEPRRFDAEMHDEQISQEALQAAERTLKLSPFSLARREELAPAKGVSVGSKSFGDDIEGEEDSRLVGG